MHRQPPTDQQLEVLAEITVQKLSDDVIVSYEFKWPEFSLSGLHASLQLGDMLINAQAGLMMRGRPLVAATMLRTHQDHMESIVRDHCPSWSRLSPTATYELYATRYAESFKDAKFDYGF